MNGNSSAAQADAAEGSVMTFSSHPPLADVNKNTNDCWFKKSINDDMIKTLQYSK